MISVKVRGLHDEREQEEMSDLRVCLTPRPWRLPLTLVAACRFYLIQVLTCKLLKMIFALIVLLCVADLNEVLEFAKEQRPAIVMGLHSAGGKHS